MIGRVIFDKTWHWVKKFIFHDWTTKKLSLKISDLDQDKLKIIFGGENSAFHLAAEKKIRPKWNLIVPEPAGSKWSSQWKIDFGNHKMNQDYLYKYCDDE